MVDASAPMTGERSDRPSLPTKHCADNHAIVEGLNSIVLALTKWITDYQVPHRCIQPKVFDFHTFVTENITL
jgi:hypothetical protein